MIAIIQRIKGCVLFGVILAISCSTTIGCEYLPESTFKLASESRLPKWITLPPGLPRSKVSVTMSYYIKPWGGSATFTLQDTKGQLLEKVNGKMKCQDPIQLKTPPQGFAPGYPSYQAITVNGVTEIIEHKKMEPVFYVTDDNAVWKQYSAIGCS
jgi:hypothetical protein